MTPVNKWFAHFCTLKNIALYLTALLILGGGLSSRAQEQSNFTHFFLNPYVINPSYAGIDGQPSAALVYRRQWMTIDGGPAITNLSLQAPVNDRVGVGMNITHDAKGFFNNTALLFSLAYHVPFDDHMFVRFGLSAGGSWNTVDMTKLNVVNDPALVTVLDQNASLAGNAGASFHYKYFSFGLALPTIFSPAYVSDETFSVREIKPFQALLLHTSHRFYFNDNKNIFEPYAVYRVNTGLPAQFEFAGVLHLNHVVWAGASYRQDFGPSALGGIKLQNRFAIGASYSIQQTGADELNSPGFEVSLNYLFGAHKKGAFVRSFVNAAKAKEKSAARIAREALARRQREAAAEKSKAGEAARLKEQEALAEEKRMAAAAKQEALKRQEAEAQERTQAEQRTKTEALQAKDEELAARKHATDQAVAEAARREQERLNAEEEGRKKEQQAAAAEIRAREAREERARQEALAAAETEARAEAEAMKAHEAMEKAAAELRQQKQLAEEARAKQPDALPAATPKIEATTTTPTADVKAESSTKERHELVKRGSHANELEVGVYVIAGVFKSAENAKRFSEGLVNLNYGSAYGYLTAKQLWYVYIHKTEGIENARVERKRAVKQFLLRDAWILTVLP